MTPIAVLGAERQLSLGKKDQIAPAMPPEALTVALPVNEVCQPTAYPGKIV